MNEQTNQPPAKVDRITEAMLAEMQSEMGHAHFKLSNARAASIRSEAQAAEDRVTYATCQKRASDLEDKYRDATKLFHEQRAQALGDAPKPDRIVEGTITASNVMIRNDQLKGLSVLTAAERAEAAAQMAAAVPIERGDIVQVIGSEGTDLMVSDIRGELVLCEWTDANNHKQSVYHRPEELRPIQRHSERLQIRD